MRIYLTILLLYALSILTGCADLETQTLNEDSMQGFPDMELFNARITYTQEDLVQLQVNAPHVSRFEITDLTLLEGGVKIDFHNKSGEHAGVMTSEAAEILERDQRLLARGNVIVRSDSGMVLYADTLYYNPDTERIRSDGFVIMVTKLDSITGWGFNSSSDFKDWEIRNTSGSTWRAPEMRKRQN